MNIRQILSKYPQQLEGLSSTPKLDVEVLLCKVLQKERLYLHLNMDVDLDDKQSEIFEDFFDQRLNHRPIQYIVGNQEFMGLDFFVEEGVLIPRNDTEILVEEVLSYLEKIEKPTVMDIGTGSGAISVSIAKHADGCKVYSLDVSDKALEIGAKNAESNKVKDRISFIKSDLFENVDIEEGVDVIVSNPPYIRREDMKTLERQVREYEPDLALDGGMDGLDFYRRIVGDSSSYIKTGGLIAFELGHDQARDVAKILKESGEYDRINIVKDLSGIERVVTGIKI